MQLSDASADGSVFTSAPFSPFRSHMRLILKDQRGAIAVLALLMTVCLVGALYYVVGIGQAVLLRERLQDAADAGAYSSAAILARGMNLLALINLIMSALLAVLVALKLVQTVCMVAGPILAAVGFWCPPCAAAAPLVISAGQNAGNAAEQLKQEIMPMLKVLHLAARGVRQIVPIIAQVEVVDTVLSHYKPPAAFGFALPARLTLPTKDDDFSVLCTHAASFVGDMVMLPFKSVPGVGGAGPVHDLVSGALEGLAKAAPGWFCGEAGAKPPEYEVKYWQHLPVLAERQACIDAKGSKDEVSKLCAQADEAERRSFPDRDDGDCSGSPCDPATYHARVVQARSACDPNLDGALVDYGWQERTVTRHYQRVNGVFQLTTEEPTPARLVIPTGSDPTQARYGERGETQLPCPRTEGRVEWNEHEHTDDAPDKLLPVCSELLDSHYDDLHTQAQRTDTVREVLQVLHCDKHVTKKQSVDGFKNNRVADTGGEDAQQDSKTEHSPQAPEDGVQLEDDNFQARVVVLGGAASGLPAKVLAATSWGRDTTSSTAAAMRELGRIQVAEAELYFDDPQAPDISAEWLWNLSWRARLRHFHLAANATDNAGAGADGQDSAPDGLSAPTDLLGACNRVAGGTDASSCSGLADQLNTLGDLIAH